MSGYTIFLALPDYMSDAYEGPCEIFGTYIDEKDMDQAIRLAKLKADEAHTFEARSIDDYFPLVVIRGNHFSLV